MVRAFALSLALSAACFAPAQGQAPPPASPYFPAELLTDGACGPTIGTFENAWYSRVLRGAGEASLLPLKRSANSGQVVRFSFLPSFIEQIIIRLDVPATGPVRLTAKRLAGDGNRKPYRISANISKTLSVAESARVRKLIAAARISQIAPKDCAAGGGLDGDTWIIESVGRGQYHYVNRWSPPTSEVRAFGTELARLVGWQRELAD